MHCKESPRTAASRNSCHFTSMRRFVFAALVVLVTLPAGALERWETLPSTPAPIATDRSGMADANGIKIHYAIYGHGSPVIFLHGGLANSDYWGNQVPEVAARHTVILMDSRGHGRSTRDARPYGYDLMADDVVALMDSSRSRRRTSSAGATAASSASTLRFGTRTGSARCSPSPPTR